MNPLPKSPRRKRSLPAFLKPRIGNPKSEIGLPCCLLVLAALAAPALAGPPGVVGDLYVADGAYRVQQYDPATLELVGTFLDDGWGQRMHGMAWGPSGDLLLGRGPEIREFDGATGVFVRVFTDFGPGYSFMVYGLEIGPNGNLFASGFEGGDLNPGVVWEVDGLSGTAIAPFVTAGSGGLAGAHGLTFGPNGNLFVVSKGTGEILEYDGVTGAFVGVFASAADFAAPNTELWDLAFGPNGNLFVSVGNDPSGQGAGIVELHGTFGGWIKAFGQGELEHPVALTFGANGNLFVGEYGDNSLLEYDPATGALVNASPFEVCCPWSLAFKPPCPAFTPVIADLSPSQADNCGALVGATITGTGLARACAEIKLVKAGEADIPGAISGGIPLDSIEAAFDLTGVAPGFWDLVVTYPDEQTDTLVGALEVLAGACDPPTVTGFSPAEPQMNCGFLRYAVITGTHFVPETTVRLVRAGQPDIPGTVTGVTPPTEITADFALLDVDLGLWDVVVTNPDTQTGSLAEALEVTQCIFGVPGDLYVAWGGSGSPEGAGVYELDGVTGEVVGRFSAKRRHVVWLPNGNLAASVPGGASGGRIEQYDGRSGELLDDFVPLSTGGLQSPRDMALGPNGNLFVADSEVEAVFEFDGATGAFIRTIDVLSHPNYVAFGGPSGNLFVGYGFAVAEDAFISEFDAVSGAFIRTLGELTMTTSGVTGLAFGPNGNLFESNSASPVYEYDAAAGAFLGEFVAGSGGYCDSVSLTFGGPNHDLFLVRSSGCDVPGLYRYDGFEPNLLREIVIALNPGESHPDDIAFKPMYDAFSQPQLVGIVPAGGDGCGVGIGNVATATLTGTDLLPNFAGVKLALAGQPDVCGRIVGGTRPWESPSEVVCEFDLTAAAAGTYDVVFSYPDGGPTDTLPAAFTVTACPPPTVAGVDPAAPTNCPPFVAPLTTTLTVSGTGFVSSLFNEPAVTLSRSGEADVMATEVEVQSATLLTAEFDLWQAAPGAWDLVVTNPDGQSGTLGITIADCTPAPTAIAPAITDNCDVLVGATITGAGFIRGTQLSLTRPGEPDIRGVQIDFIDDTQLVAEFGLTGATPGLWSLTATNPDGQSTVLPDALEVVAGACLTPNLRVRITEIYSEFQPLPGLFAGGRPSHAIIDRNGDVFFRVTLDSFDDDHLFRRSHLGFTQRVYFIGQVVDGTPTTPVIYSWWVSEDGHLSVRDSQRLFHVLAGTTTIQTIAATNMPVPGQPGVRFEGESQFHIQAPGIGGQVFFGTRLAGVGITLENRFAIAAAFDGQLGLQIQGGDPLGPGVLTHRYPFNSSKTGPRAVNANGWQLAVVEIDPDIYKAIAVGPAGDVQAVAWEGGPAHGLPGLTYQWIATINTAAPRLNDSGELIFFAQVDDAAFNYHLWGGPRDDPQPIAMTGDPAPGAPGETFWLGQGEAYAAKISLNDRGEVALTAKLLPSWDNALWLGTGPDDWTLVAREGDAWLAGFFPLHPQLNDRGDLVMYGGFDPHGDITAVWFREHRAGRWVRLAQTGDTLLGRVVNNVHIWRIAGSPAPNLGQNWANIGPGAAGAINEDGQVVLMVNRDVNAQYEAIYLAELVPAGDSDGDGDGDVDLRDFAGLQRCFTGEGVPVADTDCLAFDADDDGDVDLDDFAAFTDRMTGPLSPQLGACCLPDGTCADGVTEAHCLWTLGGEYQGDDTTCDTVTCPPAGACCLDNGGCLDRTEAACAALGGSYQGDGTECATTDCPYGRYSNEIDPMTSAVLAGAGLQLADDMTLEGTGARELVFLDLAVYGNDGGDFDVTVELYTDCPGNGGTLIPGTTFTWTGVPDNGYVYILTVDPVSPAVTIPDTVWMVATFSTPESTWIIAEQAEIGFTQDLFGHNDPPWVCNYWWGGDPYAGLWANLRCVEAGGKAGGDRGDGPQLSMRRIEAAAAPCLFRVFEEGDGAAAPVLYEAEPTRVKMNSRDGLNRR